LTILKARERGETSMINIQKALIILVLSTGLLFAISNDNNLSSKNTTHIELKKAFKKSPSILLKNIPQKKILKKLYRKNKYIALWLENDKFNKEKYTKLFKHIQNDTTLNQKGLIYKNYQTIVKQLDTNLSQAQKLHIEIKLSSLYYNFLVHTIYGEIQWKKFSYKLSSLKKRKINGSWVKSKPKFNIIKIMKNTDIDAAIEQVTPKNFGYRGLILALKKLEALKQKGTWEELSYFKRLALGSTGDIVKVTV